MPTSRRQRAARRPLLTAVALAATATLAGCASDADPTAAAGTSAAGGGGDRLVVLASFYPLQHVAQAVGGDLVDVGSLTPASAEPHDLELSPQQVREVGEADVVVVMSGFQPAVDEAVAAREPAHLVDAAQTPEVAEHLGEEGHDEAHAEEEAHAEDEAHADEGAHAADEAHAEEGAAEDDGHGHGGGDPHFWLDPTLLAAVGDDVAAALAAADPDNAATYESNAAAFTAQMTELDEEYATTLADCERQVIVTAHTAFGYLAERYGLEQVGISGIEPDAEPSPARLRDIREVVEEHGVTTIFSETLLDPQVAETLAADLGITTAVLDPVESLADGSSDYRQVMEQNLRALGDALGCA